MLLRTGVCILFLAFAASECHFPPSLWCSTKEISSACNVEAQCEKWNMVDSRPRPVELTLYYESLCSDCKVFFKTQLAPAVEAVGKILNLTLVPYGNAMERQEGDHWTFNCQHGPEECKGNLIETCAIHLVKDQPVFPFINCMEESFDLPEKSFISCSKKHAVNYTAIALCTEPPLGNSLEHKMAAMTNRLQPPHTFVPWITLNGVHTDDIQKRAQDNLVELICDSYKGPKPASCKKTKMPERCLMQPEYNAITSHHPPVSVALYYESLCPFCKIFIAQQLYPVYKKLGSSIVNITLVPYGNAKEEKVGNKYTYTCQHGPEECYGNVIETCALYLLKDFDQYFEYIYCIESSNKMPNESSSECAAKQGLDYKSISMCAGGDMGNKLEHEMAEATGRLVPPHKYVPWIVLDGTHTEDAQHQAQENLLKVVCDMYKGPKPAACSSVATPPRCPRT